MSNEHPKMLYRAGREIHHEGHDLDTLIVGDAKEEKAARKRGWRDLAEHVSAGAAPEVADEADEEVAEEQSEEAEQAEEPAAE